MSAPKLPDGLPALPPGAVYDGMGDVSNTTWDDYWCFVSGDKLGWVFGQYKKSCPRAHYARKALPASDSEAVALVRKLAESLKHMTCGCECFSVKIKALGDDPIERHINQAHALMSEAEAFLKREAGK